MHMTNLQEIIYEWQNNFKFREEFKKDPISALKNAGFKVNQGDLDKILAMLKLDASNNEKLDERKNK